MPLAQFLSLCALAKGVNERRDLLQREVARGYAEAAAALRPREGVTQIDAAIPGGILEALCIAGALGRDTTALDRHYTRTMPSQLAGQLVAAGIPEEKLFTARLSLQRMPRLSEALEALFARVAAAGLPCETTLGATTPARLLEARPSLAALYAGCHFGRSMPMLYAAPGDVAAMFRARRERVKASNSGGVEATNARVEVIDAGSVEEWIDARYAGPIAHELSHLQPLDPSLIPAPANLHEALAAWLGSEAFPEQLWPRPADLSRSDPGGLDALPGGAFFASVGAWLARTIGERDAIRAQAGALDLRDALGSGCASALRIYGWLPHLETSAPHMLADTFSPARWWKLVDLHRDGSLARTLDEQLVRPLLEGDPPPVGCKLVARWNAFLDALDWPSLPAWRDAVSGEDEKLGLRACHALAVRSVRHGGSFRAERSALPAWPDDSHNALPALGDGPLHLDVRACTLGAAFPGPDAVGAPPAHPVPPSICAAYARAGFSEVRASAEGLPPFQAKLDSVTI